VVAAVFRLNDPAVSKDELPDGNQDPSQIWNKAT
jgi:hypothetical protein